ncbi:hypothetical protein LMG032447_00903 [Convivina praedatoris]|uniref:Terminase large subunit n=2 Tax=Convivina praedatoris TaxID=2880963 RepID=A0ABN8H9L1_9LACO|nr:hypothetical protein R077815_00789 [Convivina sp. LMG 32447]CAH1854664.1 hypothetical protein LMG032447_00903 [Convivina sp. LMG 32447]
MPDIVLHTKDMINPHFAKLWRTDKPEVIAKGGRGSFKSSVISLKLVLMMLKLAGKGNKVNVICVRENANNLRDSIYNQILWAIDMVNSEGEFRTYASPLKIEHIASGSTFYFYGADNPRKLKSNTVGNIIAVWYEEAANMKSFEVFDTANPTFIRQKPACVDNVKIFYSYNPPKNPYDWVNEWIDKKKLEQDVFIDHSTYLNDELGFTTNQQLRMIENYKANDYDYYRWLYLGEVVGLGTSIYDMDLFHQINSLDELPENDHVVMLKFSADVGHSVSATTVSCYGITYQRRVVVLDTYYYSPVGQANKKSPSDLAPEIYEFINRMYQQYPFAITGMIMDSAEQALRNEYHKRYGVDWKNVRKLKNVDMIDRVQNVLAQGKVFYLPTKNNLKYFIPEHQKYQWEEKTLQSDDPKVIKVDDHTVDQFKYLVRESEQELGVSWS